MNKGIVIKTTGSWITVQGENNRKIACKIKGSFRIKGSKSTNPVAVGDRVSYTLQGSETTTQGDPIGLITEIDERKNYLVRRSQNLSRQSHVIAANIDRVFLIVTQNYPVTTATFMDRFLATAEAYRIPVILVFNKTDLLTHDQRIKVNQQADIYKKIGYVCIKTSAVTREGIPELKKLMTNKISLFSGHSGVGKSTLINLVQPGLNLKTKEISELYKTGKHVTSWSEMYALDFGGYIIDSPGIKAFGMLNMEPWEISHYFREIFTFSSDCQYNNCTHTHEPGCAVKKAVKKGEIAESRYISYLGLLENDEKYRRSI